ncbi:hypothetical protein ACLOJK_003462 [Asimina triloba]
MEISSAATAKIQRRRAPRREAKDVIWPFLLLSCFPIARTKRKNMEGGGGNYSYGVCTRLSHDAKDAGTVQMGQLRRKPFPGGSHLMDLMESASAR